MFDLNEVGNTPIIFNGGNTGLAVDITIDRVEKRTAEESDLYPDYKIFLKDNAGAEINAGFYIPQQGTLSEKDFAVRAKREVGRITHMVKAVVGNDYIFPAVANYKEAYDVLFRLLDESKDKKVNVYVTYGSSLYPKKWLGLRYFEFMEEASNNPSRLRSKVNDLLERPVQDEPVIIGNIKTESKDSNW